MHELRHRKLLKSLLILFDIQRREPCLIHEQSIIRKAAHASLNSAFPFPAFIISLIYDHEKKVISSQFLSSRADGILMVLIIAFALIHHRVVISLSKFLV